MNDYNFGNALCNLREKKGLSQYNLAQLAGVDTETIDKWETGAKKPDTESLKRLSEIFGSELDEVFKTEDSGLPVPSGIIKAPVHKKILKYIRRIIFSAFIFLAANAYILNLIIGGKGLWYLTLLPFVFINIFPCFYTFHYQKRLRICGNGTELLIEFLTSSFLSAIFMIVEAFSLIPDDTWKWVIGALIAIAVEAIAFFNGIIRVYCTSKQIGVKWRVIGAVLGWIPIANLFALIKIIYLSLYETDFEQNKIIVNKGREKEQICKTKYPLLLVHGVFFRDFKAFNYWGRIPEELKKNGALIYYGNHQSAASVEDCAEELAKRIEEIVHETGCEKVNIIAHSKGGLDSRFAISILGTDKYVASLTTINTPHRGCEFADYLFNKVPESTKMFLAKRYNSVMKKLGDKDPDFISAVSNLTAFYCKEMNDKVKDSSDVFYQSVGSRLNKASGGRFPLNFSYSLVDYFDGPNDGLVSMSSLEWGERKTFIEVKGKRGVSHGDIIDLNRENIKAFDVREFYVGLVSDLKKRGL